MIGLINKQDTINAVSEYALTYTDLDADKLNGLVKAIMKLPEPVQHGRWIKNGTVINCSACRHCSWSYSFKDLVKGFNYCPHCGAKMEE